uniref:Uncharacterized protein n=1 Tax=Rhizophora mucronata TaxID=61149 RepID=A0A2P2NUR9_RHIMU
MTAQIKPNSKYIRLNQN